MIVMVASPHKSAAAPHRAELLRVFGLIGLLLALRLALFDHPRPYHPDEMDFMQGAERGFTGVYPVHPPGYVGWVVLGRLNHQLGIDPYTSYQVWSVIASILAPLLVYDGLGRLMERGSAWWWALAFGVCPAVWFAGETALNYSLASVFMLLIVGGAWDALRSRRLSSLVLASLLLIPGMLLRPDLAIWTGPVLVYAAWRQTKRRAIFIFSLGVILLAAWVTMTAGEWAYESQPPADVDARWAHTRNVVLNTSVFRLGLVDGLLRNTLKTAANLSWDLGLAVVPLIIGLFGVKRAHRERRDEARVLLLWAGPLLGFFLLIHASEPLHLVLVLAQVYLFIALACSVLYRPAANLKWAQAVALFSLAQFLFYPWSAESGGFKRTLDAKVAYRSASGLRQIDQRRDIHRHGDFWPTAAHRRSID